MFFDDARVPVANLIGELDQGWRVATGALGEERAMLWLSQYERLEDAAVNFANQVRGTPIADDPLTQDWYGKLLIDATALRLLGYRTVAESARGKETALQSILKLLGSEAAQAAALNALETLGPDVVLDRDRPSTPHNPWHLDVYTESWFNRYVRSFAMTIAGGTSEIQRNIVGERRPRTAAMSDETTSPAAEPAIVPDSYPSRVRAYAASDPDAVVVRHVAPDGTETSLTWSELDRRSDALARALRDQGAGLRRPGRHRHAQLAAPRAGVGRRVEARARSRCPCGGTSPTGSARDCARPSTPPCISTNRTSRRSTGWIDDRIGDRGRAPTICLTSCRRR